MNFRNLLAAGAATVVMVAPATAQDEPKHGGILTHVVEAETNTYDCHASGTSFTIQAVAPHYSTLLRFNPDNYDEVVGDLAESWEVSDDGLVWTFNLHDGVTFHDGSTFDAEDMKATWEKIVNPPEGVVSVRQARYGNIESIDVVDPLTIRFTLSEYNSAMESLFASPWNCVYSAEDLAGDPNFYATNINGTGPFKFVEHVQGSHWKAERFDDYFVDGLPYLDGIEVSFLRGPGVITALAGGQVMGTFFLIAPQDAERVTDARGEDVAVQEAPNYIINLLTVNTNKPPFDDPRVRKAINLAVDRREGSQVLPKITILRGYGTMLPPGSDYALPEAEFEKLPGLYPSIEESRAEARRLLEEAGVSDLKFTLLNRSLRHPWEPLGIFLADQFRKTGIEVEIESVNTGTYFAALNAGNYDVAIDYNNTTTSLPAEVLSKYLPGNPADYSFQGEDPEMTEIYNKIVGSRDDAEIKELAAEFQRRVFEENAIIPMFWSFRPVVQDAKVKGWNVAPSTVINLDMGRVWLDD